MLDLAIIGAGPYGLSIAAHAKEAGLKYKVFGYPMDFWKNKMPPNMFIRTLLEYTGLSDPYNKYTLKSYENQNYLNLTYPLPRTIFVDYGLWFIEKNNLNIEPVYVTNIIKKKNNYELKTENNNNFEAKNVVVAVGLTNAFYIPKLLERFPKELVSHTSNHTNFNSFINQEVLVIGGGQSAWESAALLHQAGAIVELAYRRSQRLSPNKGTNAKQQELAGKFYNLSKKEKEQIKVDLERPTVSDFLIPMVEGKVKERPSSYIQEVQKEENNKVLVTFNDNSSIIVNHIIAATGYRYRVNRLSFLKPLIKDIEVTREGELLLSECFESSVDNLFFAGPATAFSHGPTFRFIAGVKWASESLINSMKSK